MVKVLHKLDERVRKWLNTHYCIVDDFFDDVVSVVLVGALGVVLIVVLL
jgi:hypothetical protein